MRTSIKLLILTGLSLCFGCTDVLEDDIEKDTVTLSTPQNGTEITSNIVHFEWKSLKGADDYRIQVYTPDQSMVLDSLVSTTHFDYALTSGSYQWRVRGENFAYSSEFSLTSSFSVVQTDDLTQQQVIPTGPVNGLYTKSNTVTLNWQPVYAADNYYVQVYNVATGEVTERPNLSSTSTSIGSSVISGDGEYQWKVKALNSQNNTETVFASRNFYVDTAVPNTPVNVTPTNNTTVQTSAPTVFNWNVAADSGTVHSQLSYTVEFSLDSSFNSIFQSSDASVTSFSQTFTAAGIYYWRVRVKDQAGNTGSYSAPFKITVE